MYVMLYTLGVGGKQKMGKMMKKVEINKMYMRGLKDGVKGEISQYGMGWTSALKTVLGITEKEEHKIIYDLHKKLRK